MLLCQNPNCQNPFNPDINRFCQTCGFNQLGKLLRNRYRVMGVLGKGGFSRTYLAQDVDRLDSPCVIKQFAPHVGGIAALGKATELFKQEAQRLYELGENHSQIPRLIAYFEQGNRLYLLQEFIPGQTLLKESQQQAFNEQQIRLLLADLLPVLKFIHQRNVIHRDIKPENIIRRQTDGKLVLIDFGGAKQVTQTTLDRRGTGIYTLGYAPIEQIAGYPCPASDLYSLGATCVRLLTQCLPVQNAYGHIQDNLYDGVNAQWLWRERLNERGVTLCNQLGEILDKLLQHLPKDRYQSAQEVLQDLHPSPPQPPLTPFYPRGENQHSPLLSPPAQSGTASPTPPFPTGVRGGSPSLHNFEFDVATVDARGRRVSRQRCGTKYFVETLHATSLQGNGVILEMVSIPGGTFLMGSAETEKERFDRESPQHQVTIAPFFLGKTPVTQVQWQAVAELPQINQPLNPDPSHFKGANRPVENISWYDAVEFCARLSTKTGREYRLPSEAEWEYACRAGTTTPFHFGETITPELANYDSNFTYGAGPKGKSRQETTPVGSFQVANAFGLYDMHGNVWEWCADPWHDNYLGAPSDGRVWQLGGDDSVRMMRGSSWNFNPRSCRCAYRFSEAPALRYCNFGLRVAASW